MCKVKAAAGLTLAFILFTVEIDQAHAICDVVDPQRVANPGVTVSVDAARTTLALDDGSRVVAVSADQLQQYSALKSWTRGRFASLASRYRVGLSRQTGPLAAVAAADVVTPIGAAAPQASSSCDYGQVVDLGPYGMWLTGSYMEDPYFWEALQLNYLQQLPRPVAECQRRLNDCLQRAKDATEMLYGFCGIASGVSGAPMVVGAACLGGAN